MNDFNNMSKFPYPGLRPFKREETDIFFGRDELSIQLIEQIGNTHFLAVVGLSGCGKSSLVRTGLLADLEIGLLPSAGIRWRIAELRPGNHPFTRLAEALLVDEALKKEYTAHFADDTDDAQNMLAAELRRGPLSLHEILQQSPLPEKTNLLLVVDQFEELFRHYQQGEEDKPAAFVDLLLKSSQHPSVYVVITMRSDFIGDCALFYDLPEAINNGLFLVPRLTREQLQEAIEGPAKVFDGQVEPELTNRLLNEMGNDSEQLPVLQHALMRMWHLAQTENAQQPILTETHYEEIGGLAKALSKHADKAFDELKQLIVPAEAQKIAEILFRRLCERDSARRDTRSPVRLDDVAKLAGLSSWQQLVPVVEVFRKKGRHFLTPPLKPDSIIDISHESLIAHWKRLKDWAEAEADSAEMYRHLETTALLKEKGQAELWKGLDLANALAWRKREQPTALWAKRYGKEEGNYFELAMRFLKDSDTAQKEQEEKQRQKEQEEKEKQRQIEEAARQQELKQAWRTAAIVAIVGLVVAIGLALWGYGERNQALSAQQEAERAEEKRTLSLFESQLTHATLLARNDDYAEANKILTETRELDADIRAERRFARDLLVGFNHIMGGASQQTYQNAGAALSAVAVSSDGKKLAAAGEKGTLVLFNAKTGQLVQRLQGHTSKKSVKAVVFHPEGEWLASAGDDKQIILWSLPTGEIVKQWPAPNKVRALAVSPDGTLLASAGTDDNITLWEINTQKKRHTLIGHQQLISGLAFSQDGKLLASASNDDTARLWQVETGQPGHILTGHTNNVQKVTFSQNGQLLATSSKDTTIRLWQVESGQPERVLFGHKQTVFGVRFIANGQYLVSASEDRTLRVWDTQSGVTMRVLQGHTASVFGIAAVEDNLFSASNDGTVKRWNTTLPYQHAIDLPNEPTATAIAPNGNLIAIGFAEGALRLYDRSEGRLLPEQQAHDKRIQNLSFNSDGTWLASASFDSTAKVWQINDGGRLQNPQTFKHNAPVSDVAFSLTDNTLATLSLDGQVGLLALDTEQKRFYQAYDGIDLSSVQEKYFQKYVGSVSYHPNGTQLLITSPNEVRRWNLNETPPKLLQVYTPTTDRLKWSTFSPDGQKIASVGRDQEVHIYPTTDNQSTPQSLSGHENTIYRVIFSPDGQQLATVSSDATLRFWDLDKGRELFTLQLPAKSGWPVPLRDFDFRCLPQQGDCWIAVPLARGKLMLYELEDIDGNNNRP
jgi:WD40 repeat protein